MTEETKNTIEGFDRPLRVLGASENPADRDMLVRLASYAFASKPEDIRRFDYADAGGWTVWETPLWKVTCDRAGKYNCFYSKTDGYMCRFGGTPSEDPEWCALGPEIADIEIVSGKCPKINGKNCAFCYKGNGGDSADCMTLSQFRELVDFMPRNLSQIAFGITGYRTNPDFQRMIEYAESKGISCNYTTTGADVDDDAAAHTVAHCGRVAVSCYEGAKDLCYGTMRRFAAAAEKARKKFPCNVHLLLSKGTMEHALDVVKDAEDGVIPNLGAIVFLRIKPVGRAKALDCSLSDADYDNVIGRCLSKGIRFGFDSCGAKKVEKILKARGREELLRCVEPCESSRFSSYFSWKREYWSCSFCEGNRNVMEAVDPFSYGSFGDFWRSDAVGRVRFPESRACESCPWYGLD